MILVIEASSTLTFRLLQTTLCGQDQVCSHFQSTVALQQAKEHLERYYSVVGITERMKETLIAMKALLPSWLMEGAPEKLGKYFQGDSILYSLVAFQVN